MGPALIWRVRVGTLPGQSCKAVIAKQVGPPPWKEALHPVPGQKKIHWLHLPKCGSSFGAVLYAVVCQKAPSPRISPHTGEECDYCGKAAPLGPRFVADRCPARRSYTVPPYGMPGGTLQLC